MFITKLKDETKIEFVTKEKIIYTDLDAQDKQIEILKRIGIEAEINIYIIMYSLRADSLQTLFLPNRYYGRIIFPKELHPIVIEFMPSFEGWNEKREKGIDTEISRFTGELFSASSIYLLDMTAQEVQELYYDGDYSAKEYKQKLLAEIEIDNDGMRMEFHVNTEHPKSEKLLEILDVLYVEYLPEWRKDSNK